MLASLVGPGIVVLEAEPSLVAPEELYEEERAHVAKAVESRRAEFGTARVLARRALARLGVPACALVPRKNRAPTWPAGVVGSITHCPGYCAVAVARSDVVRSVGIDAEKIRPLQDGVARHVLTERERTWAGSDIERLLLVFSAKEAYYKCQFPLTERVLGFHAVELDVDLLGGRFEVRAPPDLVSARGRFTFGEGRVHAVVEL